MQKYLLIIALLFVAASPSRAQIITGFGTSEVNPLDTATDLSGWTASPTTGVQTAMVFNAFNEPDFSGGIFSVLTNNVPVTTPLVNLLTLSLSGELVTAPADQNFTITLYNPSLSNSLSYHFTWNSFSTTGESTIVGTPDVSDTLTAITNFGSTVGAYELDTTGGPGDTSTVSFTFDSLQLGASSPGSPIPEPSTYALFGVGALALWVLRRRKALVS